LTISLAEVARRNPAGIAIVGETSVISFANLFDKSESVAASLALDSDTDTPVAFVARNDVLTIGLFFALWERGIPALPLNPRWTAAERQSLVQRVGARWVGADEGFVRVTRSGACHPLSQHSRAPTLLIATSGSSGVPKVVCLSRAGLVAGAVAAVSHLQMRHEDRWLLSLNLSHIGGITILLRCMLCEASVALAAPGLGAAEMVQVILRTGATLASLVPTQLDRLLSVPIRRGDLSSLRAVLLGGAYTPHSLMQRARAQGWPVLATYGMSEAGSQICTQPLSDLFDNTPHDDAGLPLPGVELKIDAGVICIRGSSLFDGYLACETSPFDHDGWFHSGDLGTLTSQGRLIPLGRRDDCIVTGGEKVSAVEVEAALLELSWIRATAVVGVSDGTWGYIIAAAVVLADRRDADTNLDLDCIRNRTELALARRLAPYKRPRRWVVLRELPLLPSGKLDRPAVRALFEGFGPLRSADVVGFCGKAE